MENGPGLISENLLSFIVAVDIGGTFTDFLGYDLATGRLLSSKESDHAREVWSGEFRLHRENPAVSVNAIDVFVHGSTVAINTVVERKGARTALVVTRGTRDVYKIGRGNRPDAYDIWFKRPEPLVPRHLTFEVEERLLAPRARFALRLNPIQAAAIAQRVAASGVDAVAVCFLHSWSNPAHELQMAALLEATPQPT